MIDTTTPNANSSNSGDNRLLDDLLPWIDRHRWWFLLGIIVLYMAGFNGQWRVGSDSASYLNAARVYADEGGFGYMTQTLSPHRYPGLTILIGSIFKMTGSESMVVPQIVMLIIGLATVFLTYRLIARCDSRPVAVLVALIVAISDSVMQHAYEMLTDLPFLFGIMLILNGLEDLRRYWFGDSPATQGESRDVQREKIRLSGASLIVPAVFLVAGLAVVVSMKRTMWIFFAAMLLTTVIQCVTGRVKWRYAFIGGGVTVAGVVLFLIFDPRRGSYDYSREFLLHLFEVYTPGELIAKIGSHIAMLFEQNVVDAVFAMELAPVLNSVATLAILGLSVGVMSRRRLWGVFVLLFLLALLIHQPSARYFVAIFPFMAYGWYRGAAWLNDKLPQPWANVLCAAMLLLWIGPNTFKAVGLVIEQRGTPFIEHYGDGQYESMVELSSVLRDMAAKDDLIVATDSSILSYYSQRQVINHRNLNRWKRKDPQIVASLADEPNDILVVEPLRPILRQWVVDELGWMLGEVEYELPSSDLDDPPWQVRRVTGVKANEETVDTP